MCGNLFFTYFGLCEMLISFGIIQLINSHMAWNNGFSTVGVLFFRGSESGHMLSLSFFLCPDPKSPLSSWCFCILFFLSFVLSWLFLTICLKCVSFPGLAQDFFGFPVLFVWSCRKNVCSAFFFLCRLV